jgi:hypothetical protein
VENLIKILGIRDAFDAAHPKAAKPAGKGAKRSPSRQAAATSS